MKPAEKSPFLFILTDQQTHQLFDLVEHDPPTEALLSRLLERLGERPL